MSWRAEALLLLALALGRPLAADEFMPANLPARSEALGGDSVADPQGSAAVQENLAGLSQGGDALGMRYQDITADVPDLGQGALALRWGALPGLGVGLLWQHLGDPGLERDRLRLGLGLDLGTWTGLKGLSLGVGLDRLVQQYSLEPGYGYAGLGSTQSQAYDAAAGLLWRPCAWFSLGAGADQLTSPNLGLVGPDVFNPMATWDAGLRLPLRSSALYLHAGQAWGGPSPVWQEGAEWSSPGSWLALRAGSDGTNVYAGAGFKAGIWRLDYVYRFGISAAAAAFGGGQGVEAGLVFGGPEASPHSASIPMPASAAAMAPAPPPAPTPDPAAASVSRAVDLWNLGARGRALDLIGAALRGRSDLPAARALEEAWQRALAAPTPTPTPGTATEAGLKEAQSYHVQGRDDLARRTLRKLLKRRQDRGAVLAALSALAHAPAAGAVRRARSKKLFELGLRLYGEGRQAAAIAAWEKALRADPDNAEALNSLTRARLQEGKTR